jgi:uncharacterized protein (DUF362 family)
VKISDEGEPARRREALITLLRLGGLSAAVAGLGVWLRGRSRRPEEPSVAGFARDLRAPPDEHAPQLAISRGDDPAGLVRRAVNGLGGMRRFVSRGDVVLVKPNAAWDRTPEQAANTNPAVVGETVRLCLDAGAARVLVADVTIHDARRCFERSGIGDAVRAAGGTLVLPDERRFRAINLHGETLGVWPVFQPFLEADKIINVPATKHHSLTGASLGIKNWYGILGGERHRLHQQIHESLADLASFLQPTLTIVDAWRVLIRNGPSGGSVSDVELHKTVLAGIDAVALDAWTAKAFWNLDEHTLRYLTLASLRGLGTTRFETLRTVVV